MGIIGAICVFIAGAANGAVILVDNFNSYTNATTIQTQNTAWSRNGAVTTSGIDSIAAGVGGTRGASYAAGWSGGTSGRVQYAFTSIQDLSLLTSITLDLNVNTAVAGTTASVQIRSGTTTFQSTVALTLTNTAYSTFTFDSSSSALTRVAGTGSYASVLSAVDTIVFQFANSGGTGSQQIHFDNFDLVTSVPEPGTTALLGLGGALVLWQIRRRRPTQPTPLP
ncbi:hypothetical protein BH09VER1_BH09VER1_28130 [soil metagenome]